jgi:hypothetical protein
MLEIEVQDQRSLEIELLLSLIPDPRGIHFGKAPQPCILFTLATNDFLFPAGDTAQSISKDSLFRFANAKSLFHTRFHDPSSARGKKTGLVPELLPLSHNYRSHRGILSIASIVMQLLYVGMETS